MHGAVPQGGALSAWAGKAGLRSHVLLAACKARQTSWEDRGRGLFTGALLTLLGDTVREGVLTMTYKELIDQLPCIQGYVESTFNLRYIELMFAVPYSSRETQNPQCVGFHRDRILFTDTVPDTSNQYGVFRVDVDEKKNYKLQAGEALGVICGAIFNIYMDKGLTNLYGVYSVKSANVTFAYLQADTGDEPAQTVESPLYARQLQAAETEKEVTLAIDSDIPQVSTRIGEEAKAGRRLGNRRIILRDSAEDVVSDITVVKDKDNARLALKLDDATSTSESVSRLDYEERISLEKVDHIISIISRAAHFYYHLNRLPTPDNLLSPTSGKVTIQCLELGHQEEKNNKSPLVVKIPEHDYIVNNTLNVRAGDDKIYGYSISNTSDANLYVALFYFDVQSLDIRELHVSSLCLYFHFAT